MKSLDSDRFIELAERMSKPYNIVGGWLRDSQNKAYISEIGIDAYKTTRSHVEISPINQLRGIIIDTIDAPYEKSE